MTLALTRTRDETLQPRFFDQLPHLDESAREVLEGLHRAQKAISPKYFYDHEGSRLFEEITKLPEYYLTRTEIGIFRQCLRSVAEIIADETQGAPVVVECGSGSSEKARILIDALDPSAYMAVDISREFLISSTQALALDFPALDVYAICADYSHGWHLPHEAVRAGPMLVFFPGSSIGNFEPEEAVRFLASVRSALCGEGWLLIGVDPPKHRALLEAAYNDSQGVTARFNVNLLSHLNQRFGGDFNLRDFSHRADYNAELRRIEMYLRCRRDLCVRLAGEEIGFAENERIHTENSYKYSYEKFVQMSWQAGYRRIHHWTDASRLFSVFLLKA